MTGDELLNRLADHIVAIRLAHPTRVAIDGVDGAGKTMLADALVAPVERRGRQVIRASIDGFHRPRAERYQRGADSPAGYFHDSFNYPALRATLLEPLADNRKYRRRIFDYRTDRVVDENWSAAARDAILLFDGVFLLRPALSDCWDYRIFVHADFDTTIARAVQRDSARGGAHAEIEMRYRERYVPGQQLYFASAHPQALADAMIDNNDPQNPRLELRR